MFIILFIFAWFVIGAVIDYIEQQKKYVELEKKFENLKFEHFKFISDSVTNDKELQKYQNKYNNLIKEYVDVRAKNVELHFELLNKRK